MGSRHALVLALALAALGCGRPETVRWSRQANPCPGPPAVADWETAAPESAGLDAAALAELRPRIEGGELANLHAVLVVKGGRLVVEEYFEGEDTDFGRSLGRVAFGPDVLHDLRSVTKSVTSALVGIALADGALASVEQPLAELLPDVPEDKRGLTLRHALTMSAGLAWDESVPYWDPRNSELRMTFARDPVRYVLERPFVAAPGERWEYSGGATSLLAAVVERATGKPLDAFAWERLFCPLGVERAEWKHYRSGLAVAASGLRLRPRDLARLGLLYLHEGRLGERELVPSAWVRESTRTQIAISPDAGGYGFQWWVKPWPVDGRTLDVPIARGNGGQRIYLFRELDLVVVVTAGNYDDRERRHLPDRVAELVLRASVDSRR